MLLKFFSRKIIYSILGCVFSVFIFANCFSHWEGDDATIIINFDGVSGNRATARDSEIFSNLYHIVTLTGPSKMEPVIIPLGASETKISVVQGRWDITVEAYSGNELFANGSAKDVVIKAGQNRVEIDMDCIDNPTEPTVDTGTVEIKIIFNEKDGIIELKDEPDNAIKEITISTNSKNYPEQFTVTLNWQDVNGIRWYIWGSQINGNEDESITIKAKDYNPGTYQLMVMVFKDGIPYSTVIDFIVAEGE